MTEGSNVISKLFFSRYTIEVKGLQASPKERWREASERTLAELLNPDMTNRRDRNNKDTFLAEAAHRIITPFNAIGFPLIALALVLTGPFNRRGQSKKIMMAGVLIVFLQALDLMIINAARKDLVFIPGMAVLTFTPILLGFFLLNMRGEQWVGDILRRWRLRGYKAEITP
jgi:lipopolysaccharide export system permease protein